VPAIEQARRRVIANKTGGAGNQNTHRVDSSLFGQMPGRKEPPTFPACQLRLRPAESLPRLTPLEALVIEHGFIRLIFRAMPLGS